MPAAPSVRALSRCFAAAAGGLLIGCSSSVIVESTFPTPLVEPLPVRVGVIFTDELHNYIYAEEIPEQSTWTIALGDANVAMFEPLFDTMFAETRAVTGLPIEAASTGVLDGVLRPVLEKFEFDVPLGERDEFVEVWMQYKLGLYEPDGDLIIDWPVSGYGKSELERDREEAVRRAAIIAMREVGATISTKFAEQPEVAYWLREKQNATAPVEARAAESRVVPQ
jgi:hypothetical protein